VRKLKLEPENTLRRITKFLGLTYYSVNTSTAFNKTIVPKKNNTLLNAAHAIARNSYGKRFLKKYSYWNTLYWNKCWMNKPRLDAELKNQLKPLFANTYNQLETKYGLPISQHWK
jgi:hypothetical protein